MHLILYAGLGWLAGCFTPSIGRTVKSWFSKEATAVKAKL
jgi:hypothetical protein